MNHEDCFLDFPTEIASPPERSALISEDEPISIPAATHAYAQAVSRRLHYLSDRRLARPLTVRHFVRVAIPALCACFAAGVAYGLLDDNAGQLLVMTANLLAGSE